MFHDYPHWREHLKVIRETRGMVVLTCVFCDGERHRPLWFAASGPSGTIDRPREQYVYEWDSNEPCPVCQGLGQITVPKSTREDPWIPCETCETYGRVLEIDGVSGTSTVYNILRQPCPSCHGKGFTLRADREHKPYTGETRRLSSDELP